MSVWYCIPSARPAAEANEVLNLWRERGYKIALFVEPNTVDYAYREMANLWIIRETYPGYAAAVNELVRQVMRDDPECEWFVTGGDDVEPDLNHTAEEIARECSEYFYCQRSTFGVMQPTGDRWGSTDPWAQKLPENRRAYVDRVCGSPWMGREFCRRIYGGKGPLWHEFEHMHVDEHLQAVAEKLGILWQRPDLTHHHRHWARRPGVETSDCPKHLERVSGPEHWQESKAVFNRLKLGGFVEAEDLLP